MTLSPFAQIRQLATAHFLPRCLHLVAELGVADCLGEEPMTAEALARAAGVNADALHRMLRLLATAGVFEARGDRWAHTGLSRIIRSDHPRSMRPYVLLHGSRQYWFAVGDLGHATRTGRPVVEKFLPGGVWSYFRDHPDAARTFNAAMEARAGEEIAAVVSAFDFTRYGIIADIGGGSGHILRTVLAAAQGARGILFDQPEVVADFPPHDRISVQGGDFRTDPLPKADAYIVSYVLHNWGDKDAESILRSIRSAAPTHAELLLLESMLAEGPEAHQAKVLDVEMLVFSGGRERSRAEFEALLAAGGFRLERVVPTTGPASIIVGVLG